MDDRTKAYEATFEIPKNLRKGEYASYWGYTDRDSSAYYDYNGRRVDRLPNGATLYVNVGPNLLSPGESSRNTVTIHADKTLVVSHFAGVMLCGKMYMRTDFTDHDGTGWVRFVDMAKLKG